MRASMTSMPASSSSVEASTPSEVRDRTVQETTRDIEQNADTLDIPAAAARITVPWLIIHGTTDESVRFKESEALKAENRRKNTRLLPIDRGGHTFGAVHPWHAMTPELELVFDQSLAWLAAHLT